MVGVVGVVGFAKNVDTVQSSTAKYIFLHYKTRNPSLNRTNSAPTCSKLWDPIIPKIACTINPDLPASPSPRRSDFIILEYFIILDYYC